VKHLLVTNDFPPKVGGIQSYLWELWRRLPSDEVIVLTTSYDGAEAFDRAQPFRIERVGRVLLPTRSLARRVDAVAAAVDAGIVMLDPALPVGRIGPRLERPYGLVLHGAEVTIPGRLPGLRGELAKVLRGARLVVAAGGYPAHEAERAARASLPTIVVPPGVDVDRFRPIELHRRAAVRRRLGVPDDAQLLVSVSRLVPRKGMDVLVRAASTLQSSHPRLQVLIAGSGRSSRALDRLAARTGAPVRLLGRVSDDELVDLLGAADVFAMLCRNRWAGLEQEGFGIVFLEAAACGVPQVAGRSGGSHEAVVDGVTGFVVDDPTSVDDTARALARLLDDEPRRVEMGRAARTRVSGQFTYDALAAQLGKAIDALDEIP
jgi:phosphatidylinositol alpha-1,6-mannosyltransferase